mgnify:CR=1 FL=1
MRLTLLALAVLPALAACGKGSDSDPASSTQWPAFDQPAAPQKVESKPLPKACALVTAAQAEALLQQPVSLMSDEPENCLWASAGNPGQITMLMVNLIQNDDEAMALQVFQSLTGLQGNLSSMVNEKVGAKTQKSGQEIEEIGDEAWMSASNMDLVGTRQLVVRKGAVIFHLNITGMSTGSTPKSFDSGLIALAKNAVSQL